MMVCVRNLDWRRWSLARQLVLLQVCVVVSAVGIEAMTGLYQGPGDQSQPLGLVTLTEVALLVGIAGSLFLADRVRRQTFNMEPAVIARHYQHHHAMLHAIREGLIITDPEGAVVLANDEARRLLRLPQDSEGRPLSELLTHAEWAAWGADDAPIRDQIRMAAGRVLMLSRIPAEVDGIPAGMVTTLRDRTELHQALNELGAARARTTELRRQSHEFANRLQVIVRLIEAGKYDQAIGLCTSYAAVPQELSSQMLNEAADDVVAALLLDKNALAKQRNTELRLSGTPVAGLRIPSEDLITVLGNLLDNAIEAVAGRTSAPEPSWAELTMLTDECGTLYLTVRDNGPGISVEPAETVFAAGWSTKKTSEPDGRGFGLAAVHSTVMRLNGTITVHNDDKDGGAVFQVRLPHAL
jgi:two-component system CitB family sensor kinase